ncbi:glycosyltransferase 61 family protein [Neokomagataea thailandica]|uniref:Capsular polysaccharide biosynthesis protein-like protein n=1 Tax=Neokomagataea tanensis NBRC 106556 TaxID=1223519 RepID=A0ABQ0QI71_9PROT|nr:MULTISPECIES: glycosyltransferase family 61 protein [Neokomagataea]GBR45672.1 capsular polysaccharide biosynthesis protein-like protein [Neokomagataea tanensis NBRC 106556]
MALKKCTGQVGRVLCVETSPSLREAYDALCVPPGVRAEWGLFEPSGRCVPEAMTYNGIGRLHAETSALWLDGAVEACVAPGGFDYVYIGPIEARHSFFYRRSLARFWALPAMERRRLRLVYTTTDWDALQSAPYFQGICAALNLEADNFFRVTEPVRFSRITVPAASFEELSLIHSVHTDMMHMIGKRWVPQGAEMAPGRVVYISKENLPSGNVRVGNERDITKVLRERGVGIIFPETLSFREQIEFWASNPVVVGFDNSFLNISSLFPQRNIINIAHGIDMWTTQMLFDSANHNKSDYIFWEEGFETVGAGGGFNMTLMVKNPEQLAHCIVDFALAR